MADQPSIIIKKVKKVQGGGHHGGAWKVAYADFVTAMMAFFLLLWLLNATTAEQRQGISNYFSPTTISESTSGAGSILDGVTVTDVTASKEAQIPAYNPTEAPQPGAEQKESEKTTPQQSADKNDEEAEAFRAAQEKALKKALENLQQEIQKTPELKELSENIILEMTKDGLLIQLVDSKKRPMFEVGKSAAMPHTAMLLRRIRPILDRVPNPVQITGHTDNSGSVSADYGNWELSADRANTTRRLLQRYGLKPQRFDKVVGKADTDPLLPEVPSAPINRRIGILLSYMDAPETDKRSQPVTPIKQGVFENKTNTNTNTTP
ncbi:MAG: flagellar motor protein MotB [Alphaproteobacteria bacterium]